MLHVLRDEAKIQDPFVFKAYKFITMALTIVDKFEEWDSLARSLNDDWKYTKDDEEERKAIVKVIAAMEACASEVSRERRSSWYLGAMLDKLL